MNNIDPYAQSIVASMFYHPPQFKVRKVDADRMAVRDTEMKQVVNPATDPDGNLGRHIDIYV